MRLNKVQIIVFFLMVFGVASCKKDSIIIPLQELNLPTSENIRDVIFTDPNSGFAVGGGKFESGEFHYTTDAGDTWISESLANSRLNAVFTFPNNEQSYLVGIAGLYLNRTNPQTDWSLRFLQPSLELHGIQFLDENTGIAVGGDGFKNGVIYRFNNSNGNTDTIFHPIDHEMRDVQYLDEQNVIAVGYGLVTKSMDGGASWTPNSIGGDFFYATDFPTPQVGYIIGHYGMILKSTDSGNSWKKLRKTHTLFGIRKIFRDVKFINQDTGFIVGNDGLIWRTDNGGDAWSEAESTPDVNFNAIWIVDGVAYIAADEGKIYKFNI